MIYFGFTLGLPITIKAKHFFYKEWKVSKNKTLGIYLDRYRLLDIIGFSFAFYPKQCHGGVNITIDFFGHHLLIDFADNRHWDDENNCWEDWKEINESN